MKPSDDQIIMQFIKNVRPVSTGDYLIPCVCAYCYTNEIHLKMNDGGKSHKINENMNNAKKDFYFSVLSSKYVKSVHYSYYHACERLGREY